MARAPGWLIAVSDAFYDAERFVASFNGLISWWVLAGLQVFSFADFFSVKGFALVFVKTLVVNIFAVDDAVRDCDEFHFVGV